MFDTKLSFIQVPRPKSKISKREQAVPQLLELLANDRQSQAGHMLNNLSTDSTALIKDVSALHAFLHHTLFLFCFFLSNTKFGSFKNTKVLPYSHKRWQIHIVPLSLIS